MIKENIVKVEELENRNEELKVENDKLKYEKQYFINEMIICKHEKIKKLKSRYSVFEIY